MEKCEESERLEAALAKLPPDEANAIRLFYYKQKSYAVIAEILSLPLGTIKSHIFRGLRRLAKLLGDDPSIA